jgi:type II secretion system protein N
MPSAGVMPSASVIMIIISKNRTLFGAYIILIAAFFLYYLFPADSVKTYISYQLNKVSPKTRVTIAHVTPALPPGIRLYDVDLYHLEHVLGSIEKIKIVPEVLSLFRSKIRLAFNGEAYGGHLSGNAEIVSNSPMQQVLVDTTLTGIQVKDIDAIQNMSEHKLSGTLDGKLAYKSGARNQTLQGNLILSDCKLEFAAPLFDQGFLTFRDVKADLMLNNQRLDIQKCVLEGNQMNASISGSVTFNHRTGKNVLDLRGTIKPHHVFLAQIEKSLPVSLLKKGKSGDQGFAFKIKGTSDAPEFSFN